MATRTLPAPPTGIDEMLHRAEEFARQQPTAAVASAFGFGFLLNMLPLRGIAAALVGIAFACTRPALLFLGVLKACEYCRAQTSTPNRHE